MLLRLETDKGTALGEAAPLPGFSTESLEDVIEQYREKKSDILQFFASTPSLADMADFIRAEDLHPSLEFGLDTLGVHYLMAIGSADMDDWAITDASDYPLVNGILGLSPDHKESLEKIKALKEEGITTLKVKVGDDFERESALLQEIRAQYPNLKLRIDANGVWALEEAEERLGSLDRLKLEYCEEPLADPSPKNLKKLKKSVKTPLALDEGYLRLRDPHAAFPHIDVLVVKPMVYGSFAKIFATKEMADDHNITLVFTTALEIAVGRRMTALLAGLIGSPVAHGLDTGRLLQNDPVGKGTYVRKGRFIMPSLEELADNFHQNRSALSLVRIE